MERGVMDNQHKMISGYRDFDQQTIDTINLIKEAEAVIARLWVHVNRVENVVDSRWWMVARTHFEQGFMALVRSVAKPDSRFDER